MCVAEQTNSGLHPRVKGYNTRFGRPVVAVSTQNVCCRVCHFKIAPKGQRVTRVWRAAARTHCEGTCVLQNRSIKDCTHGSRVTIATVGTHMCVAAGWQTNCCCEHTHVCVGATLNSSVLQRTCVCSLQSWVGPTVVNLDPRCSSALIYSETHMCVPAAAGGRPNLCVCPLILG